MKWLIVVITITGCVTDRDRMMIDQIALVQKQGKWLDCTLNMDEAMDKLKGTNENLRLALHEVCREIYLPKQRHEREE